MTHDTQMHLHLPDPPRTPRPNQTTTAWTDELKQEVRVLWETKSAAEIAAELNARGYTFSTDAVRGALKRMGLTVEQKRVVHPKTNAKSFKGQNKPRQIREMKTVLRPEPFICRELPQIEMKNLSLLDLEEGMCRYPSNNAKDGEQHLFCGRDAVKGKPYCTAHARICFEPAPPPKPKAPYTGQLGSHRGGIFRRAA